MKKFFIFVIILSILAVCWVIPNLSDAPADPDFADFMSGDSRPPDAQNGFISFLGLSAPLDQQPYVYGLQHIKMAGKDLQEGKHATFYQLVRLYMPASEVLLGQTRSSHQADGALGQLKNLPAQPYIPNPTTESLDCWLIPALEIRQKPTKFTCMTDASLQAHIDEIQPLLNRYLGLHKYPRFYETYAPPYADNAVPSTDIITLHHYYLARNILLIKQGKPDQAFAYWLSDRQFLNRVLKDQQGLVTKAVFMILSATNLNALKVMTETDPTIASKYHDHIMSVLFDDVTKDQQGFIKSVFRGEYQLNAEPANHINGVEMHLTYKKNATANTMLAYYRSILEASKLSPANIMVAGESIRTHRDKLLPETNAPFYEHWAYNPLGKFMVASWMKGDELMLQNPWREQAIRRMLMLYVEAHSRNITAADMPAFLLKSSPPFYDPFTGKPFVWDAEQQAIAVSIPRVAGRSDPKYMDRRWVSYP